MWTQASRVVDLINLPAGTRVGDWRITSRLGWGGYGVVYLVKSVRRPRRQAALKLALRPGQVSRRLAREKLLLERIRHPHVVRLLDSGFWRQPGQGEPLPFIVLEY
ncbi:MAG TPA: serine/threonine protein kinase, partial [Myxococcaceae bacterium]|nr:serine/threonine protein kinase [Myxococcaceae bacterium]